MAFPLESLSEDRRRKDKEPQIITVISTDVYPSSALHHSRPLQDVVVGLPLHLVLQGSHFTLCFSISQVSCGVEGGDCETLVWRPGVKKKKKKRSRKKQYLLPELELV